MFKSMLEAARGSPLVNPIIANCEGSDDGLKINETRTIAAADAGAEDVSCEFGSTKYFALCGFGGILSCGLTHTAVVPLDLVKCRIQVDPAKYGNIISGFRVSVREAGMRELGKGWAPTMIGYSMQGLCKFGFYEVFKSVYSNLLGEEKTFLWRTSLYLAASASAEFFADIALCPMEAVKVRIQTQPGWANTLREGVPKLYAEEGLNGFYKGIGPLWARQIPYTMMKFACFERTVEALYKYVVPKARSDCSKSEQLVVTFIAGYIAGVFCAIVSHPADTIVSKLNNEKNASLMGVARNLGWAGEDVSCEYGSRKFFLYCGFGGILSCGTTHTAVVPLDLVKCRIQVNPSKYGNIINGFRVTLREGGPKELGKGWAPTFFGYSCQGLGKFGLYEVFKVIYSDIIGEEKSYLWRTSLYLAASASAEFFADLLLCPFEAVKVRIQTQPGWANTLREGMPKLHAEEGIAGFYKGIGPLWARQIPYTMMKFACFERTVEALYKYVVPKARSDCSKSEQLVVTFVAGYIAGVFCAIVSHPADTIVSKLNNEKNASLMGVARNLGWAGMWKGLGPRIIMIGTLTALQWFIYDSVKVYFRLPRPPPPEMPASLKAKLGSQ